MNRAVQSMARQQGAVLIMAVFVVSVMVVIAARFTSDYQLSVARIEQSLVNTQIQQLTYSVESFAAWVLIQDAQSDIDNKRYKKNGVNGSYDHLKEEWTNSLQAPIDEASVDATLSDAMARFNINQLEGRPSSYKEQGTFSERFTTAQQRFIRLLQTHPDGEIDQETATHITQAVIDWLDSDDRTSSPGGAEENFYSSSDTPYRPANRRFVSVTELRQVKGMTTEIYNYLAPLLIALPNKEGFNLNTAPAALMRSLQQKDIATPLSDSDATILMGSRPEDNNGTAYQSVEGFLESSEANQVFGVDRDLWPNVKGLRTGSEYFILTSSVTLLDYQQTLISIIKRETVDTGVKTKVLRRTRDQL